MRAVLLLSIVLVQAPVLFGSPGPPLGRLICLAPIAIAAVVTLARRQDYHASGLALTAFGALVALTVIEIVRAVAAGTFYTPRNAVFECLTWLVVGAFAVAVLIGSSRRELDRLLPCLAWAPIVYVATNVILQLSGVAAVDRATDLANTATLLSSIGIALPRTQFPMATGFNDFGVIAGSGLVVAIVMLAKATGSKRAFSGLATLVCLYGVLRSDSRAALFLAVPAILLVVGLPAGLRRRLGNLPAFLPLSPLLVLAGAGAVAATGSGALSRQAGDLATATGRSQVWQTVANFLLSFDPHHLVGYGAFGPATSGLSYEYAYLFSAAEHPEFNSTHNLALQTVMDSGYLGLAVLIVIMARAIYGIVRRLQPSRQPALAASAAALIFLIFSGVTEASPTIYHPDAYAYFMLLVALGMRRDLAPRESDSTTPQPA